MRTTHAVLVALLLGASNAFAQATASPTTAGTTPPASGTTAKPWTFDASAYVYFPPDESSFAIPMFSADRGRLHLEARYNYEATETGSLWLGANFSGGKTIEWEITPMVGAALGATPGVAPGYKGSLTWRKLELYSEGEYFLDSGDSSGSFFYNWSEFSLAPTEWFRVGFVLQRTRVYETERDIQRGLLAGLSYKRANFTTYVFNPGDNKPVVVLGMGVTF